MMINLENIFSPQLYKMNLDKDISCANVNHIDLLLENIWSLKFA